MLVFDNQWRFDSPGPIERGVVGEFLDLINRISGQGPRKAILEHFKSAFAAAAGGFVSVVSGLVYLAL
jgi:hypothetical protein